MRQRHLPSNVMAGLVRRALVLGLCCLSASVATGQERIPVDEIQWFCSFDGSPLPADLYGFTSDQSAEGALTRLLRYTGLARNFVIKAANVDNAVALVTEGERHIYYNQDFMRRIAAVEQDWAALSILAHEVGHHLQGHTLRDGGSVHPIELEADQFSGFILERMGATLDQAQAVMKNLASLTGNDTHPPRDARLAAITNGWISSCELNQDADATRCSSESTATEAPGPTENLRSESSAATHLDYTLAPTYGEVSLTAGFRPDPHTVPATSGGSIDASYIGTADDACRGHAAAAPDYRVRWDGPSQVLRIFFTPDGASGDTTLLVNLPNGDWMCNDDADDLSLDPEVAIDAPQEGQFDIWIGSYNEGESIRGTLSISELGSTP